MESNRLFDTSRKTPTMWRITLPATICFSLLSCLLSPTTVATPAPVPAPVNSDPCGPRVQEPNFPDTCSVAPVYVQSPQPYGVNCTAIIAVQGVTSIAWSNCSASLQSICTKLVDTRTRTAIWIWSQLAEQCALGFFIPPYQGSAPLPTYERCTEIFTAMANSCQNSVPPSNFAGVNLRTLPGHPPSIINGQEVYDGYPESIMTFKGNAVNVGYPSYAIGYTPSTNPNA